ncbi:uncharacterized protein A1O5_08418 [Cladophialophora psammophila CBS 110553]|uniref:6-methylsalicylate decarboxylase n=1 Tax=Cladophialophora psammophila CBS 110553 TaxID=1182543 RepID=W9XDW8_9EURO|nr:uncharacterized protein A1O5_08418 [Cladophialophora psammophila CBS 110553]EXJ68624.1 hypothetical protein A1O5_08418 [Cladophialophora psammophila CBS 110553]
MTSPGPSIAGPAGSGKLARTANDYLASVRDKSPAKYGFFAAMPDLTNTEAALAEIQYAHDTLGADGIMLMTSPEGSGRQECGSASSSDARCRHESDCKEPTAARSWITHNETTRTAIDLIMSKRCRTYKNVKIILSHAGGTLPYLAKRAASLGEVGLTTKTVEEILDDTGLFYFDLALSSSQQTIQMLLQYTTPDHILYFSDSPYAPRTTIDRLAPELDQAELEPRLNMAFNRGNALKLFPRFGGQ